MLETVITPAEIDQWPTLIFSGHADDFAEQHVMRAPIKDRCDPAVKGDECAFQNRSAGLKMRPVGRGKPFFDRRLAAEKLAEIAMRVAGDVDAQNPVCSDRRIGGTSLVEADKQGRWAV